MIRYLALLRGINVGGNNKVPMAELKTAFEGHGFTRVSTYINSGNVLFSSDCPQADSLSVACRSLIRDTFGMEIPVAVIAASAYREALGQAPPWWNAHPDSKHNTIFVLPPATAEGLCAQVGELNPKHEQAQPCGPLIFWSAPRTTFSRTKWLNVVGTPVYNSVTIRNANTTLKLLELFERE